MGFRKKVITFAAMMVGDLLLVGAKGERHHDLIRQCKEKGIARAQVASAEQGFVNHKGEFLNREDAGREALACGQVIIGHANIRHPFDGIRLYSEDLW
jgi:hypothetical protein